MPESDKPTFSNTSKIIYAFDPGHATGMAIGEFSDDKPLQLIDASVFVYEDILNLPYALNHLDQPDYVVAELFELNIGNEFVANLEAKKVEGVLEVAFPVVAYRRRGEKNQISDDLLREIGWWKTGAEVNWEDGRDANDAINHMLGFVAFDLEHLPTLRAYFR